MYEDWKSFEIHIGWYAILLFGIFGYSYWYFLPIGFNLLLNFTLINLMIVFGLIFFASFWTSIKSKKIINIFKAHFGIGDLLSIILFSFWFPPNQFLTVVISASVIGLILERFRKTKQIPLASYLSGCALLVHFNLLYSIT